jgi:hypothetical protein
VSDDNTESSAEHELPRRCKEINFYIQRTKKRIEDLRKDLDIYEETLSNLESYTFKEGDVVVSKSNGIGIVSGIGIGEDRESVVIDQHFPGKFYVVLATSKGYIKVPPNEITPYTLTSKVLYER